MTEYDNTNRGVLFRNDRREKESQANMTGRADVVCSHCGKTTGVWVSAWTKIRENGEKWLSLSFKPREKRESSTATGQTAPGAAQYPQPQPAAPAGPGTDDLPF